MSKELFEQEINLKAAIFDVLEKQSYHNSQIELLDQQKQNLMNELNKVREAQKAPQVQKRDTSDASTPKSKPDPLSKQ